MSDKRSDDLQEDGGIIFGSKYNNRPMIMKPLPRPAYDPTLYDIKFNQVAGDSKVGETNPNENNIVYSSDERKALEERIKKRDVMTDAAAPNNEQDNIVPKQNGDDSAGPNTIVYVQMPSRL